MKHNLSHCLNGNNMDFYILFLWLLYFMYLLLRRYWHVKREILLSQWYELILFYDTLFCVCVAKVPLVHCLPHNIYFNTLIFYFLMFCGSYSCLECHIHFGDYNFKRVLDKSLLIYDITGNSWVFKKHVTDVIEIEKLCCTVIQSSFYEELTYFFTCK